MAYPQTPSRPPRAPNSGTDPPDRGGSMLTDLLSAHPWAVGFSATPMRPSTVRSRAEAFEPTPDHSNKQSRPSEQGSQPVTGSAADKTAPVSCVSAASPQEVGRPTRSAAVQAAQRLTKEAQAAAVGLSASRRSLGSLGESLGITPRSASDTQTPSPSPSNADKEGSKEAETGAAAEDDEIQNADKDQDVVVIAAVRQRQVQRTADMTELCRAIDKACTSGAVSPSGAELLHAALATALRHGELGAAAPALAPALINDVRKYQADKPHQYQRSAALDTAAAPLAKAGSGRGGGTATAQLPPTSAKQGRRWENLSGLRTLGGSSGSAQAAAAKGGLKAKAVVVTLAPESPALRLSAVGRRDLINKFLVEGGAPGNVRVLSTELNGRNLKLKPVLNCSLEELFQEQAQIRAALGADEIQDSKQWVRYKVLYVPEQADGVPLTAAMIRAGIEESIGATLTRDPHRLQKDGVGQGLGWHHVQFAVLEDDKVKRPWTVSIAGEEYQVAVWTDRRRKDPCTRCLGYHKTFAAGCHNQRRCEHCGSAAHSTMEHQCKHCADHEAKTCPPVCPNCNGPHRFDDRTCKMAPRMNRHTKCWLVPSPAQARVVRNQGLVDHQRAIKALSDDRKRRENAAKASALAVASGAAAGSEAAAAAAAAAATTTGGVRASATPGTAEAASAAAAASDIDMSGTTGAAPSGGKGPARRA
ncbi:hypothetical protein OC842_006702 [Tilletia horrida]|uniref:Uncharacterized protein n=1 Tax=Tilletia horrida TaxID=155126 RepID=A0AAN6JHT8_9BASI|nr:hypothetical protein OC842_006702 [Tilletia horrida]